MQECVPPPFYSKQGSQHWLNMTTQHMQQVQPLNPHQARAQFLGMVSAFPMFGSSFFYIQSLNSASIHAPCILAVNLNGLHFLNKDTHVCYVAESTYCLYSYVCEHFRNLTASIFSLEKFVLCCQF
uniref:FERM domain-containing protein n=1 Tax=Monopterus albus TaxID=43700 RepID=A0A3Q3R2K5_MONAL